MVKRRKKEMYIKFDGKSVRQLGEEVLVRIQLFAIIFKSLVLILKKTPRKKKGCEVYEI
jgi:hypothetical protein